MKRAPSLHAITSRTHALRTAEPADGQHGVWPSSSKGLWSGARQGVVHHRGGVHCGPTKIGSLTMYSENMCCTPLAAVRVAHRLSLILGDRALRRKQHERIARGSCSHAALTAMRDPSCGPRPVSVFTTRSPQATMAIAFSSLYADHPVGCNPFPFPRFARLGLRWLSKVSTERLRGGLPTSGCFLTNARPDARSSLTRSRDWQISCIASRDPVPNGGPSLAPWYDLDQYLHGPRVQQDMFVTWLTNPFKRSGHAPHNIHPHRLAQCTHPSMGRSNSGDVVAGGRPPR